MNIAIFTNNYLPYANGVVHSVESFRKEIERRGHNVYVFAPKFTSDNKNLFCFAKKNPVVRFAHNQKEKVFYSKALKIFKNSNKGFHPIPLSNLNKIKKIIQDLEIDIIHSQQPIFLGKTAQRCAKKMGIPLVFTNHTLYHECVKFPVLEIEDMIKQFVALFVVKYANCCQKVIVPTLSMKKILIQVGVKTSITVIPSGINLERFKNPGSWINIRKKYNIKLDDILLVLVSRLSYEKNILFLLSAFKIVYQRNKKIFLMIVGDGLYRKKLEKTRDLLSLKNVIFAGKVDYSEIFCYYKESDIFVYPCLVDSQGLVIVEAMAAGLPVIALKNSVGPKDIIQKTQAGLLVDESEEQFAQAILKIASDSALRKQYSKQAFKRVEKYSIKRLASKMIQLYNELI